MDPRLWPPLPVLFNILYGLWQAPIAGLWQRSCHHWAKHSCRAQDHLGQLFPDPIQQQDQRSHGYTEPSHGGVVAHPVLPENGRNLKLVNTCSVHETFCHFIFVGILPDHSRVQLRTVQHNRCKRCRRKPFSNNSNNRSGDWQIWHKRIYKILYLFLTTIWF